MPTENLRCPNCGAYYKDEVPKWVSYVKCGYCGATILVKAEEKTSASKTKTFEVNGFAKFLAKKGCTFDPISGMIKMGNVYVQVDERGSVSGPLPQKRTVERWIEEYLEESS